MDITVKFDLDKKQHHILGIVDHGSRANLCLKALTNKTSISLLRCLLDTIEKYGKPEAVRTDNEAVFVSKLFRFSLWLLGIKHQKTDVGTSWQNGRIERFFGTLKEKLNQIDVLDCGHLNLHLRDFRFFYNHVRTHQNIDNRTPAEVWSGNGFKRTA
ncbi:MAG: transposase family protein, partial [Xanthomonadales bacterium]|nr:transposase family protein [Xanthomonadales bacterium]